IDLTEETPGIMPTRQWKMKRFKKPRYQGDTIPVGIGQGYWTATPVQMNKALIALINNGVIKTHHLMMDTMQGTSKLPWRQTQSTPVADVNSGSWEIA
ncbi:penicillin-binding protein 2, partial [Erwinia amylovora]|uniref:penicillin-binding transpeptidase domain-containing protein n=1 Tax=Erwinia amylovora TaxID=552 RepID=UPI00200A7E27